MCFKLHTKFERGFTLIELMVSVSIFSMVMVMAMGSILSVLNANKHSTAVRVIMDDMNYTLEGMTKTIRFSTIYHCGSSGSLNTPNDCNTPSTSLSVTFTNTDGSTSLITYALSGTSIVKTVDGTSYTLTSPSVTIQNLSFWVIGSDTTDNIQPRVAIVIKGIAGQSGTQSDFNLETTISQRKLDI